MYAYITLKFEIVPEEIENNSSAQIFAEEIAQYVLDKIEADEIVKVEVKHD